MFSFFRSTPKLTPLETGKSKVRQLVKKHLQTLVLKRRSGITKDAYGIIDGSRWNSEAQYFMNKVVLPELTLAESIAIGDHLNEVANEIVEAIVSAECYRLHDAGQLDMTVPVSDSQSLKKPNAAQKTPVTSKNTEPMFELNRGLIIRPEPLEKILSGQKIWEMRSRATKIRGPIALIKKGSKAIYGIAHITDSRGPLSREEMEKTVRHHGITTDRIDSEEVAAYRHAWVLEKIQRLDRPIPYQHSGGVTFVTLDPYAVSQLQSVMKL